MTEAILDANVLLRYLTGEPLDLADRAAAILEESDRRRFSLVLAPLTLAEVVYVLGSVYGWELQAIATQLLGLASALPLVIIDQPAIDQAIRWYRDVPGIAFADAYVAALATTRGHGRVVSFDRHMRRIPGITPIEGAKNLGLL